MSKKVLVIDDHAAILGAVEQVLGVIGLEFMGATDGNTGLNLASTFHPDLVVCDYYMQGLTGLQVFDRLRKSKDTAGIPFVLMSMDDRLESKARLAGVDGFVSKGTGDLVSAILQFVA